jgi:membrane fusion protein (multidrug efflux system)
LLKKHLFLVLAVSAVALAIVFGAVKLLSGGDRGPGGGPGGAPGGGFAGGPPGGGPGGAGGAPRGQVVTPAVVAVRTFSDQVEVLGAAKARQSITVTAPASQLVTKINFQSGQFVRAGQVLAELNAREQDATILQSRSQVALAKSNWDRWQQLADKGIAPAATAENYKAQYDQALATLQVSQARAGDRVIRAPFSGFIGLSDAAPGMMLNSGAAIATLDDLSTIRVDFPVSERYISLLRDGLPITATADAYPGKTFQGRIAQLDTRLDATTRAIMARAEFPNPGNQLRPGMLLRVVISQGTRENPSVPESAVIFEGGQSYVLAISPAPARGAGAGGQGGARPGGGAPGAGQGGGERPAGQAPGGGQGAGPGRGAGAGGPALVALQRTVQTGVRQGGFVEVLAGLQPGDRVVADGTNRIRPNDPVRIGGPGAGGGGAGGRPPGAQGGPPDGRPPGGAGGQGPGLAAPKAG